MASTYFKIIVFRINLILVNKMIKLISYVDEDSNIDYWQSCLRKRINLSMLHIYKFPSQIELEENWVTMYSYYNSLL